MMEVSRRDNAFGVVGRGARTALLVIDMLNDYDHSGGAQLQRSVTRAIPPIRRLISRARASAVPVIWVNDSHGRWSADRDEIVSAARNGAGAELIDPIAPDDDAPFLAKARHSIFYGTPLEYLLETEGIGRLVLTGQVTEQCILYSALDAYIRHFGVAIPRDAVAHIDEELADAALRMMERNMRAEIADADGTKF